MTATLTRDKISGSLLRYRIMAFATGVMLLAAVLALIVKHFHPEGMEPFTGYLWVVHGYLYLVYVVTVVDLALRVRWGWGRIILIALAGTIPTASFFAEHYVTQRVRRQIVE